MSPYAYLFFSIIFLFNYGISLKLYSIMVGLIESHETMDKKIADERVCSLQSVIDVMHAALKNANVIIDGQNTVISKLNENLDKLNEDIKVAYSHISDQNTLVQKLVKEIELRDDILQKEGCIEIGSMPN